MVRGPGRGRIGQRQSNPMDRIGVSRTAVAASPHNLEQGESRHQVEATEEQLPAPNPVAVGNLGHSSTPRQQKR
jgi:hypothetical protein